MFYDVGIGFEHLVEFIMFDHRHFEVGVDLVNSDKTVNGQEVHLVVIILSQAGVLGEEVEEGHFVYFEKMSVEAALLVVHCQGEIVGFGLG